MKIRFQGTPNSDEVADAFVLAFLASRKGAPVTALQVWKSLHSRGFVPADDRTTSDANPDEGAAVAEISTRLQEWLKQGEIGGDGEPEALTKERHFWVLGNPLGKG
ncbi:MAG TPA: hypothetical protein VGP88_07370 [Thermoplasmata archaeon]|jgi:hypothetical protein|nr:hypothetical protein [Thermoplasmata archaeon]